MLRQAAQQGFSVSGTGIGSSGATPYTSAFTGSPPLCARSPARCACLAAAALDDPIPAGREVAPVPAPLPLHADPHLVLPGRVLVGPAEHVVGVEHLADGPAVDRRDVGRQLPGERQQLVVRHHVVHQAPGERGRRVDEVAGDAHLLGPADPHGHGQADGEPVARQDPDPGVRVGEAGPLRRHEEVAAQRQLETAGDAGAVDRPDDGGGDRREVAPPRRPPRCAIARLRRLCHPAPPPAAVTSTAASVPSPSSFRSTPAQNAGSAPVSTIASTSGSASSAVITSGIRAYRARLRALRRSGRFSVTTAMPSRTSTSTMSAVSPPAPCVPVPVKDPPVDRRRPIPPMELTPASRYPLAQVGAPGQAAGREPGSLVPTSATCYRPRPWGNRSGSGSSEPSRPGEAGRRWSSPARSSRRSWRCSPSPRPTPCRASASSRRSGATRAPPTR